MPVGTYFSRVHGGKMAVSLETMKDSEIQYVIFRHAAVGYGGRAAVQCNVLKWWKGT
jgi:hypothetical protein